MVLKEVRPGNFPEVLSKALKSAIYSHSQEERMFKNEYFYALSIEK